MEARRTKHTETRPREISEVTIGTAAVRNQSGRVCCPFGIKRSQRRPRTAGDAKKGGTTRKLLSFHHHVFDVERARVFLFDFYELVFTDN